MGVQRPEPSAATAPRRGLQPKPSVSSLQTGKEEQLSSATHWDVSGIDPTETFPHNQRSSLNNRVFPLATFDGARVSRAARQAGCSPTTGASHGASCSCSSVQMEPPSRDVDQTSSFRGTSPTFALSAPTDGQKGFVCLLMKDAAPAHLKCQAAFSTISLMGSKCVRRR